MQVLKAVRATAPRAEVAILGYPWILPATRGCFPLMPVAEGDLPYLPGVRATLNDAIRRAAKATGVTFVDLSQMSEGHDACQPIGVRWVEPVLVGTNPVIVHAAPLSPACKARRRRVPTGTRCRQLSQNRNAGYRGRVRRPTRPHPGRPSGRR